MKDLKLWYDKAATRFEEALPIGNGRLGGMVYGDVNKERITLNEDTLWSGVTSLDVPETAFGAIDEIRELLAKGDRHGAGESVWKRLMGEPTACYEPAGTFFVELEHKAEVSEYRRKLDLECGVCSVEYVSNSVKYRREVFSSFPDNMIVVRITASKPVLTGCASFSVPHQFFDFSTKGDILAICSKTPYYTDIGGYKGEKGAFYDQNKPSVRYAMGARAVSDGKVTLLTDKIEFSEASQITFLINIISDFPCKAVSLEDLVGACADSLSDAADYAVLKERHIDDYSSLFGRVDFTIEGQRRPELPTDQRLIANWQGEGDAGLYELLYQFGRYLLISSSRPGSQPATLQGIWNEELVAPWSSGYTVNINAEMNYWPAEVTNLSECHEPLLRFVKELAKQGEKFAESYGCRGWCAHHNTDVWRYAGMPNRHWRASMPSVEYACWPMGGAWLTSHLWQHYLYSGDVNFLRDSYPVIQGCAAFLLDFLIEDKDGYLVTSFGSSPENSYWYEEKKQAISQGCTMDMAIIRDIWNAYLESSRILGEENGLCEEINEAFPRLLPYRIGERGQLMEWEEEFPPCQIQHRHLSPLYGFYPGNSITKARDPELTKAVETLLAERGDANSGWSMGWKVNMHARLGRGDRALDLIRLLLKPVFCYETPCGGVYANLLDSHPPFQIDGNFGVTAGITEMLLQSHEDYIELLPALPKEWGNGHIRGIVSRGGFVVDVEWADGALSNAKIKATVMGNFRLLSNPAWVITVNGVAVKNNESILSLSLNADDVVEVF